MNMAFLTALCLMHRKLPTLGLLCVCLSPAALRAADEPVLRDPAVSGRETPLRPLFAGSWQKDFGRSDK